MKCNLKKKLILFSFICYCILKAECNQVNGTTGGNVNVTFTFQDLGESSLPQGQICLHKNEVKIGKCHIIGANSAGLGKIEFNNVDVANNNVTLCITNLTLEDTGMYHVVLHNEGEKPLILSNNIYLTVNIFNKTTEMVPSSVHETTGTDSPQPETSEKIPFFIFLSASLIICSICLFVSLLCWFHRTCPRKSDNLLVQNNSTSQQGDCGRPSTLSVSCVEYGELDFHNRPERHDRVKSAELTSKGQDGVEYAAIIFPQQKQTPSGRMRDVQQVAAIR
ncbi:uncharacterized protein LOC127438726 [Myxocyprinus asiaticus]|uniref:uncharacterized protein LOC127438726 n=1 Tax=Myxocyprinus asiaticus TaxID=70543 RepID=UPI002222CFE1|nr:uncharacterized protein LOC127438726 [Myxocyprinus asiaticus]XP_051550506.1 uncharacterized protein LOC127438726 [Myxocyprinus asiaticus]